MDDFRCSCLACQQAREQDDVADPWDEDHVLSLLVPGTILVVGAIIGILVLLGVL